MSDFMVRRDRALRLLERTGISEYNYCPPWLRLAWRRGLRLPPPHFTGFLSTAVFTGIGFSVLWMASTWLFVWRTLEVWFAATLFGAALGGRLLRPVHGHLLRVRAQEACAA